MRRLALVVAILLAVVGYVLFPFGLGLLLHPNMPDTVGPLVVMGVGLAFALASYLISERIGRD